MTAEFNNSKPIYSQIVEKILLAIAKGELAPGAKVNPVRDMAAEFKVNPNTMQRSLAKLEEMGYMYTERTSGRYVTNDIGLIESLKASLPAKITEEYITEMVNCGIARDAIPSYVNDFIERGRGL